MAVAITPSDPDRKVQKRIIVACDGTWQDADADSKRIHPGWKFWRHERRATPPSNVARLCRCLSKEAVSEDGKPVSQVVFYQAGIGTSFMQKISGGLAGVGITGNIRDAYAFICNNYEEGDEIFLFGFSRGAFTARSISTLIHTIGILNPAGLAHFYSISQDWKNQNNENWRLKKTPFVHQPFGTSKDRRPSPTTTEYIDKLKELGYLRTQKPPNVKCCGVWDTVGSLGVPRVWFVPQKASTDYSFVNTNVESNIEYAFQALALDERRGPFAPTIWAAPRNPPKVLKQTWFRGVHCDVGGGAYPDQENANLSLAWMISQLEDNHLLKFNRDTFWKLMEISAQDQNRDLPTAHMPELSPWGRGRLHDSMKWYYKWFTYSTIREPRAFGIVPPHQSMLERISNIFNPKSRPPLEGTNEFIHSSVAQRDTATCQALARWKHEAEEKIWVNSYGATPMQEDALGGLELELSQRWDDIRVKANESIPRAK